MELYLLHKLEKDMDDNDVNVYTLHTAKPKQPNRSHLYTLESKNFVLRQNDYIKEVREKTDAGVKPILILNTDFSALMVVTDFKADDTSGQMKSSSVSYDPKEFPDGLKTISAFVDL